MSSLPHPSPLNPTTMDSLSTTPPSHHSKPRLPHSLHDEDSILRRRSPFSPSPLHLSNHASGAVPLHDLLLLSPSPRRKPKSRPAITDEHLEPLAAITPRKKAKNRAAVAASAAGLIGCASPRNLRRARRRLEKEVAREERDSGAFEEDVTKPRKRRQSKSKVVHKEKLSLIPVSVSSSSPLPNPEFSSDDGHRSLDGAWEQILELVLWKNVAKSTLWFGFGSIFFFSSSLSRDFSFSIISALAHLGILILAVAFFYDSFPERQQKMWKRDRWLTEDDVLRAARVILPTVNSALAKIQEIFSGEPMMTLKVRSQVAPVLLLAAKYGHLITLWRLLVTGFFMSFTVPKLYSCYSLQIHKGAENVGKRICEAWKSCRHKRVVAASTATVFWNLFNVKARIFAAFFSLVIARYYHQHQILKEENIETERTPEHEQQQAMVLAE